MNQNAFLFSHFFFLTYADFYFCSFLAFPLPTASLHSSLFSGRKASVEKDTFAALLKFWSPALFFHFLMFIGQKLYTPFDPSITDNAFTVMR